MKTIYNLVIKDVIRFLNDKPSVILTFIVPMALIVIFGSIFGGSGGPRGKVNIILVNESNTPISRILESKLDSAKSLRIIKKYLPENGKDSLKFDEAVAKEYVKTGKISAAVVMPQDFFTDTSSTLRFKFYYDPKNEIESSIIQGQMQQTIMTQVPRLIPVLMRRQAVEYIGSDSTTMFVRSLGTIVENYFDVSADSFIQSITRIDTTELMQNTESDSTEENQMMGNFIEFESEQLVGQEISNPGLTRSVGGWAIMFLLFSLTGAATSLFEEKQEGSLKRLLCMPVSRSQILWSKYIYTMLLGIVQLYVLFIFSWAFFDVDVFSNFLNLFVVIIASVAAAVSFGMLITSVAKTINQANGISTLVILIMSAVGGSWFPVTLFPDWMQAISKATLTYWSVEAFLQVLWRQAPFSAIVPNILILLFIAFLINAYALVRFKNGKVF